MFSRFLRGAIRCLLPVRRTSFGWCWAALLSLGGSLLPDKLYAAGKVEPLEIDNSRGDELLAHKILQKARALFDVLKIKKELPADANTFRSFSIGHQVGFSLEQEYKFLTLPTEIDRQQFMFNHLEQLIPIVKEMERLRERIKMNGHFKNIKPPAF